MSQLTLPACPICHARDSLSPETMVRGEQSFLWYQCAECGSVLLSDYYKTQMPGFGWSKVSAKDLGAMFMLEFTKEGKTASIMLQPGDSGGTSALITTE